MITEKIAKEKCEKYGLNFSRIAIGGGSVKCKLNLVCSICNNEFITSYCNLHKRKDCICVDCTHNKYRISKEKIGERLRGFGASAIDLDQYTISTEPIDIRCRCGSIFKLRINDIPKCKDISCKKCKNLYTKDDIKAYCEANNINLIEIESNNSIKIKCSKCNKEIVKAFRSLRIQKQPNLCQLCSLCKDKNEQPNTRTN